MRRKFLFGALLVLSVFAFGQNPSAKQGNNQAAREQAFEARRQNFTTGRQLLLDKGVPFDPDELLRDGWTQKLKSSLDAMPEMHQVRHETAPLNGAYFADTLYLPEKVELSGHTVILANYVVFEGTNPVIKGHFDVHFFPTKPVTVLDTTLADLLHKQRDILNVRFTTWLVPLPPFSVIQDLIQKRHHIITFDTSGAPPQALRPTPRKSQAHSASVAWSGSMLLGIAQADCNTGCDHSGNTGATGGSGVPGTLGIAGANQPKAPDGDCSNTSINSNHGQPGQGGGNGEPGTSGANGLTGGPGSNANNIDAMVADNDTNQYKFIADGGTGGLGGQAGDGGDGGNGGKGGDGGNGIACVCDVGEGGDAGNGGNGGSGGNGANGGPGGNGGAGGVVTVSLPFNSPGATTSFSGGLGGMGGGGGRGGIGGMGAQPGVAGVGATACNQTGPTGRSGIVGSGGASGQAGNGGANGQAGPNGSQNVTRRSDPSTTAGGGGTGTCLGGSDPSSGLGSDGSGGGVAPLCSPIIVDTEREGFHLTSPLNGVTFDVSGTGHPVQIAWTDARFHNAFLALPGPDGLVHNGKGLFGNFTPQPQSAHPNGFLALAQYDKPENGGNGDGMIDDRDEVFSRLRLWIDENHDGICQPGELHRLPELGVYSLALNYVESRRMDQFGNQFRYKAIVNPGERRDPRDETSTGEPGRWTYDVFFVVK